ncbi:hypothetical protein Tco_0188095, partial [Tanacetum coccineum]
MFKPPFTLCTSIRCSPYLHHLVKPGKVKRMAPIELKELKDQLQELLERGFIHPS